MSRVLTPLYPNRAKRSVAVESMRTPAPRPLGPFVPGMRPSPHVTAGMWLVDLGIRQGSATQCSQHVPVKLNCNASLDDVHREIYSQTVCLLHHAHSIRKGDEADAIPLLLCRKEC